MATVPEIAAPEVRALEAREAGATLLARVSPQERAAILLKDVFDFALDEIAEILATTPGAVKAALHRGREKLAEPQLARPRRVAPAVLNAFCEGAWSWGSTTTSRLFSAGTSTTRVRWSATWSGLSRRTTAL